MTRHIQASDFLASDKIWSGASAPLVCVHIRDEAPQVKTFVFSSKSGARFKYWPGQHLVLSANLDEENVAKAFTIASAPTRPERLCITIKRNDNPGGRVSAWFHDNLVPGMEVEALGPFGQFGLRELPDTPLLLISAGSGATPMISMCRTLSDLSWQGQVSWIHVGRHPEDLLFKQELEAMSARHLGWQIEWILTGVRRERRPGKAFWQDRMRDNADARVFCCGPRGLMDEVRSAFNDTGGNLSNYSQESFHVADTTMAPQVLNTGSGCRLVTFQGTGKSATIKETSTILEAARTAGVVLPSSCREGICGTCLIKKISGDVIMQHKGGIAQSEIEEGYILACCSFPQSDVRLAIAADRSLASKVGSVHSDH